MNSDEKMSEQHKVVGEPEPYEPAKGSEEYKLELVWRNIIGLGLIHLSAVYGLGLVFTSAKIATTLFALFLYLGTAFATTGGAHRLWSHRAYKAKWPLRLILVFFQTMAFQDSVYVWARDHRVHHKYSDTNADPHNINRGFFFAHIGWLLCRKHPDLKERGRQIDLSDLDADPILAFQKKHYYRLFFLVAVGIPWAVPALLWCETWWNAFFIAVTLRYVVWLNITFLVNSAAHTYGNKPYDKNIHPRENKAVAFFTIGEGWHNYHHTFPWDYKTSELGDYTFNFTAALIDFFAKIGWAYDMKTASGDVIMKRTQRTGDGSHPIWGWGDKDQTEEQRSQAIIVN